MGQWIWKFGDFETFHNALIHDRRQTYGKNDPPVWKLYTPDPLVRFKGIARSFKGGHIKVTACGHFIVHIFDLNNGQCIATYRGISEFDMPEGDFEIHIRVYNPHTLPCVIVEGALNSGDDWLADDITDDWKPVGTWFQMTDSTKTPEMFPFCYEAILPTAKEYINGGVLFDFGKETFARTRISNLTDNTMLYFGESKEEALDKEWSVIRFNLSPVDGQAQLPAYAFRYVFVEDKNATIEAEYEFLPLTAKGSYEGDRLLEKIWNTANYTFHLNCREFMLDGIKRDRWVWSGDAYQSQFVNHYLFMDKEIEKRTLIALGGKAPIKQYINTIMDYTFFWIIGCYEYYLTYGDALFLKQIYPTILEHVQYFSRRIDSDGFIRGKDNDWIFIDWAEMDKTGALLGEQILLARALECFAIISDTIGLNGTQWLSQAKQLQNRIFEKFLLKDKGLFIDSYESGRNNISRHSNILAYLFLPCENGLKDSIYNNVICNNAVPAITTPYFKFYEYQVHADRGNIPMLEELIADYYGSMLDTGATTLYEEFDPTKSGVEHYQMYDRPFEKSLCHAWSTCPIYILGRFRAGVKSTGVGYATFEVEPFIADKKAFDITVPLPDGYVKVSFDGSDLKVLTNTKGGTLKLSHTSHQLVPDKEISITV